MRKFSLLLSTIVVLALLLTACGGQETTTSIPSTNVPPVTLESTGTEAPSATEAPTSAPGTSDLTTTPGVPVTGENNPSRASTMMMPLMDQNNTQVGQVEDLVLDLDNTRVAYLVVQVSGVGAAGNKTVLVPWDSVQLQTSAANATSAQGNVFILLADPNFLNNAPDTDINTVLPGMGQPAGNWDADIRNFWATGAMPSTTQSANTPSAGNGTSTGGTSGNVTGATATASTGGTVTNATATSATAGTGTGTGTGNNQGQGQSQLQNAQGVVLASQVLGSTITFGAESQGQAQATSAPDTTATATTGGNVAGATATPSSGGTGTNATATTTTGGTGTGVGNATGATQATVADLIIDQATGDLRYLVIRTAEDNTRWIPIPIGFLRWDATNNGFVLMISANALQNAPAFAEDQFSDTSITGWDTEFSTFWQNNGGTGGAGATGTGGTGGTSTTPTATP